MIRFVHCILAEKFGAAAVFAALLSAATGLADRPQPAGVSGIGNLPLYFEPTAEDARFKFTARSRVSTFSVAPDGVVLTLNRFTTPVAGTPSQAQIEIPTATSRELRLDFVGANSMA